MRDVIRLRNAFKQLGARTKLQLMSLKTKTQHET